MGRFFEARKHTILARSDRVSKQFARCGKDILIAVKSGGDNPDANPALRRAIQNARAVNMPKDKIEAAIKRASSKDIADLQECIYEGYAPHGVAVMAVAATDNPTRTIANVRVCFNKGGGSLGTSGSVAFGFDRMGVFRINPEGIDRDALELDLIDYGLEEMGEGTSDDGEPRLVVRCPLEDFGRMQNALEERALDVTSSTSEFVPQNGVELDDAQAEEVMKLIELLEDDDDVQQVFHNLL